MATATVGSSKIWPQDDGTKELVAIADGYRESIESWADVLRDLKRRGMRAPTLAVGDGALGFWGALREVFPDTRAQRCWVHYAEQRVMPSWGWESWCEGGFWLLKSA
jgi:transposase-like protein